MMVGIGRKICLISWVVACVAVAGCGGQKLVTVTGEVVEGGQPVVLDVYEEGASCLEVDFCPLDEAGNLVSDPDAPSQSTYCKEDGSFVVEGYDGKGIPAGKYRVAVRRLGQTPNGPGDVWQGKFERDKSPFVVDVPSDDDIVIDIAKAGGQ